LCVGAKSRKTQQNQAIDIARLSSVHNSGAKIFRRCPGRVPTAGDGRDRATDWSLWVLTLKPGMPSGKGSGHRDGAAALLAIAPKNRSILSMKERPGRQQKKSGLWD
jgi:hypothetical protein